MPCLLCTAGGWQRPTRALTPQGAAALDAARELARSALRRPPCAPTKRTGFTSPNGGGPIPLHRYRKHRKSRREVRADQVGGLTARLSEPRAALSGKAHVVMIGITPAAAVPVRPCSDPDPFHELSFATEPAERPPPLRPVTSFSLQPAASWAIQPGPKYENPRGSVVWSP